MNKRIFNVVISMIKKTYIRIFSLIGIYIVSVNLLNEPITISIKNFIYFMLIVGLCYFIERSLKRTKLNKYIKRFNIVILIITSDCNALRTKILANKSGYINCYLDTSSTVLYLIPAFYVKEAFNLVDTILNT